MAEPDPIQVELAIEFLEDPHLEVCERCGEFTKEVCRAVLTMNDEPVSGPQLWTSCRNCDGEEVLVDGRPS